MLPIESELGLFSDPVNVQPIVMPALVGSGNTLRSGAESPDDIKIEDKGDYDRVAGDIKRVPDGAPSVSFDIELGKKYSQVNFDYDEFSILADEYGMNAEDRTAIEINVTKPSRIVGGSYYSIKRQIKVGADKKVNNTFAHELKHASDDFEGKLITGKGYIIGSCAMLLFVPSAVISAASSITMNYSDFVRDHVHLPVTGTHIGIMAVGLLGYRMHPIERRAFKAGRKQQREIITLQ